MGANLRTTLQLQARIILLCASLRLAAPCHGQDSYQLTICPGASLIANQLNYSNGNSLNNILLSNVSPFLPDGCELHKYLNVGSNGPAWASSKYYQSANSWVPNIELNPGEGAFLFNSSNASFTVTFTGTSMPSRTTPYPMSSNYVYLLSDLSNETATYSSITGDTNYPPKNTILFQWIVPCERAYGYESYSFGVAKSCQTCWAPYAPSVEPGRPALIRLPGLGPPGPVPPIPPVYLNIIQNSNVTATLTWQTGSPSNPYAFVLQASSDLTNWTT